jgi:phosphoribosylaminoimidazolecarboxamide formyltransferase/IMP cyclohydrolase/phosphoribosylaminoimidazolecarboxamide formyltransferase
MPEISLKYGCNPNQSHARITTPGSGPMGDGPLLVVNGEPSYINALDGLRAWQLVRDLKAATGKAAAASYKHVSPAGVAVAGELSPAFLEAFFYPPPEDLPGGAYSPVASAYAKARSSDRVASFGDFIAVSEPVDITLAQLIKPEVSDGIIAPAYEPEAFDLLRSKKGGRYVMFTMDPAYEPPAVESRTEFGLTLEQSHNDLAITPRSFGNLASRAKDISDEVMETLVVTTITLKHTQSNSIAVGYEGQAVGIGAGQQSRIACTRIACDKADRWLLKTHPKTLGLRYADGLAKAEKVNAQDNFVRYQELNDGEKAELAKAIAEGLDPITPQERSEWLSQLPGVVLSSDAFIPFRDNLDRAAASGVSVIAQAGGSARDDSVTAAADEHSMVMCHTGIRLFLH